MPKVESILAFALFVGLGAMAAGCDAAHKFQACQVPVKGKLLNTETTVGYTEGVCFPVVIDDEGESASGEPEVVVSKLSHNPTQSWC